MNIKDFVMDGEYEFQFSAFDETVNWILFGGLAYLLTASAPKWFRSYSWDPFSKGKLPANGCL